MPGDVLFLGAGFSRGFGLPTMAEFFRFARDSKAVSAEDKTWLTSLQQQTRNTASMLGGSPANLEHVLSLALMDYAHQDLDPGSSAISDYTRMVRILRSIYGPLPDDKIAAHADRLRWLFRFGRDGEGPPGDDLTVITTNYDLLAEYCLYRLQTPARLAMPWKRSKSARMENDASLYTTRTGPTLCKLHGSISWLVGAEAEVEVQDRVATYQRMSPRMDSFPYPLACDLRHDRDSTPLIVPPMYFKHQPDPRLNANWTMAARAIATADRLAFVGYSFPPSDTHMAYFLAAALNNNMALDKISIVAPDANDIRDGLKKRAYGEQFKDLLVSIGTKWEESSYGLL